MTKNEAFVSLLAMTSVAKLLRSKKEAQEIRGTEVETPEFDEARQKGVVRMWIISWLIITS